MRTRYVGFHFVILLLIQLEFLKLTELKSVLDKRDTMVEISYQICRNLTIEIIICSLYFFVKLIENRFEYNVKILS